MTAEDICWRTAAAACLPNALRQGASRAPREKILGARHEAWRVFSRRNRKRETSRPIAFAGECSTACMCVGSSSANHQRLFDRFEAL